MKHLKFLMLAFTLMMGFSLTSCMGESDPTVRDLTFGKVISSFPIIIQAPYGTKFTATNSIEQNLYEGDYVYFQYSYNSETQKVDANTKNIDAQIVIGEKMKYRPSQSVTDKGEEYENATVLQLGGGITSAFKFQYYDKNKLLLLVSFLGKESIDKHDFVLAFNESEIKDGDTDLKFYLRHRSSEDKPKLFAQSYRLFDMESALNRFAELAGRKPTKIVVYANETADSTTDALDKKKDNLTEYSLGYEFKE